ncbi:MAG TPA: hypothetical protein VIN61_04475 [Gammaproteobacteria bacterium]
MRALVVVHAGEDDEAQPAPNASAAAVSAWRRACLPPVRVRALAAIEIGAVAGSLAFVRGTRCSALARHESVPTAPDAN